MVIREAAFATGLGTGLFLGLELKTGQDVTQEGLGLTILQVFCSAVQKIPNSPCDYLWLIIGIFLIVGILTIISDYKKNGILYAAGLFLGMIIVQ
ncbi:MAG: hypothetical protein ABIG96_02110 [Candidatus Micrarchaeota archaeon]